MRKTLGLFILTILTVYSCENKTDKHPKQQNRNNEIKMEQSTENQNREDTFVISQTFETDKKTLFNMWTDPETYTSWMGPTGAEMSFLNSDVKENGTALWQMTTPDQLTKYGKLHYKTINPNQQLVYVQNFSDKDGNL